GVRRVDRLVVRTKMEGGGKILRCRPQIAGFVVGVLHRIFVERQRRELLQHRLAVGRDKPLLQRPVARTFPAGFAILITSTSPPSAASESSCSRSSYR